MAETDVRRLFERLDNLHCEIAELKALMNAKNNECQQQDEMITELRHRLTDVEKKNVALNGNATFLAWMVTAGIALYGVLTK